MFTKGLGQAAKIFPPGQAKKIWLYPDIEIPKGVPKSNIASNAAIIWKLMKKRGIILSSLVIQYGSDGKVYAITGRKHIIELTPLSPVQ